MAELHAGGAEGEAVIPPERLFRIASRLGQVPAGSPKADQTIHEALGRAGPILPYTTDKGAAAGLLPPGFKWMPTTYSAGWVYSPCRRSGLDGE